MDRLSPDTTLAIMQTTQVDTSKAASKLKNIKSNIDLQKAEAAAQEFEAVFIAEMMKPMFEGISTEAPFGGGKGEEVFRNMLLQEYGGLLSQTGGVGIAAEVKEAMIRMQNEADGIDLSGAQGISPDTAQSIENDILDLLSTDEDDSEGDNDATSN